MNLHQRHLEDLIFYEGPSGLEKIKTLLKEPEYVSLKMDGSPSFFIGRDFRGDLFVSTKSIANKNPKIYFSSKDLELIPSEDLRYKLNIILKHFQDIPINGIIQGDFLFDDRSKYISIIDDIPYLMFHPNTLIYGIPYIRDYKLGVALHTHYNDDMTVMKPFKNFLLPKNVWETNLSVNFQPIEINLNYYPNIDLSNKAKDLEKYFNKLIRSGHKNIIHHHHFYDIANELNISANNELYEMLKLIHDVAILKIDIINRLNGQSGIKTWYKDDIGLHVTNHEGFVINHGGAAYKLVNRTLFSYLNFSPSIYKGWNEPTRK